MSNQEKKVVGIGHNSGNTVSKEQYAKLLNQFHRVWKFSQQEMRRVERFLDEAFTKYPCSNPNSRKLKDFEVYEARAIGKEIADKFSRIADSEIEDTEKKASMHGVDLDLKEKNSSNEN